MSKGSKFKNNLASKLREKQEAAEMAAVNEVPEQPGEMVYKDEGDAPVDKDQVSVATEVVDGLSVAPTEMLANEYKRLVEQYE